MSEISPFDPALFLDATTTEAATRRPPLPIENPASPDGLYTGVLGEPKMRKWSSEKGNGWACDILITVEVPPQLQDTLHLQPQVVLMGGGFVDTTPGNALDWSPGRNRMLRNYREATNQNKAGENFSLRMLTGKPVKVQIKHDIYQGDTVDKVNNVFKF